MKTPEFTIVFSMLYCLGWALIAVSLYRTVNDFLQWLRRWNVKRHHVFCIHCKHIVCKPLSKHLNSCPEWQPEQLGENYATAKK